MRAAIIGFGVIGKLHAKIIPQHATLEAVCDIDERVFGLCPDVRHYTDYKKMLDEVHPDVVHICTPHYLHADMVIEALGRGINVLCEKPLCIRESDIGRILEAEKNSTAQLGVCLQNRYNGSNLAVKSYLEGKTVEVGIGQVSWHRDASYYASGDWRGKWDTEGGGVLINQALHTLDLMQWFCGMPENLAATVSNLTLKQDIEVEDTASILCSGGGNFNFYATIGTARDCPVEITLRAEDKWIKIMPKYTVIGDKFESYKDSRHAWGKECYGSGHEALLADYYDCVATGRKFAIDGAEGAKVVKLILAAYRSGGEWVRV
ncbi:MAG: Gfo/Idh/MocA family oxidoreductase [Clostridia bacterium]|nr:Gfo/Idh/MocA family oxidoreductase [Clostridia bacterium]